MKSLAVKLADQIMYLSQLGLITPSERTEYAALLQLAMRPHSDMYYRLLEKKLESKADTSQSGSAEFQEAIKMIDEYLTRVN